MKSTGIVCLATVFLLIAGTAAPAEGQHRFAALEKHAREVHELDSDLRFRNWSKVMDLENVQIVYWEDQKSREFLALIVERQPIVVVVPDGEDWHRERFNKMRFEVFRVHPRQRLDTARYQAVAWQLELSEDLENAERKALTEVMNDHKEAADAVEVTDKALASWNEKFDHREMERLQKEADRAIYNGGEQPGPRRKRGGR